MPVPPARLWLPRLSCASAVLLISLAVVYLYRRVPLRDDMYCFYSNIAWTYYPLNRLCWSSRYYDLAPVFNWYLPLRSYYYVGSLTSWIYYPLFLVWPSPDSVRLLGLIALGVEAMLVGRICRYGTFKSFLLMLLFMPYSNQHVIDTGPSAWQIVCMLLIILATERWVTALARNRRRCWHYPLSIALLTFTGVWSKLSFIFYLPIIPLFLLYHVGRERTALSRPSVQKRFFAQALLAIIVSGVLVGALLNSRVRVGGKRYFAVAEDVSRDSVENHPAEYTPWKQVVYISRYFTNPLQSASLYCAIDSTISISGVLMLGCIALWLIRGAVVLHRRGDGIAFVVVNMLALLLMIAVIASFPGAYSMHHTLLGFPFLILPMVYILARVKRDRIIMVSLTAFMTINLLQFHSSFRLKYGRGGHIHLVPHFEAMNRTLAKHSAQYVFCHVDWGFYHLQSLYGSRDQCNVRAWPLDSVEGVGMVRDVCRRTGRRPMFIRLKERSGTDIAFLEEHFPGVAPMTPGFDAGKWEIWYVP